MHLFFFFFLYIIAAVYAIKVNAMRIIFKSYCRVGRVGLGMEKRGGGYLSVQVNKRLEKE